MAARKSGKRGATGAGAGAGRSPATRRRGRRGSGASSPAAGATTFYICRSCVWTQSVRERDGRRQGTFLLEAVRELIEAEPLPETLTLRAVYCLNGCLSPCNVAFRAAGKHHVRFSRLTPENAEDVLAYARAYQASADGEVPEDETPATMRGKMTVRTPPLG